MIKLKSEKIKSTILHLVDPFEMTDGLGLAGLSISYLISVGSNFTVTSFE